MVPRSTRWRLLHWACVTLLAPADCLESGPPRPQPIISGAGRERLLREAERANRADIVNAQWHSHGGEIMLAELLSKLPAYEDEASKGSPSRWRKEEIDMECLWLLCRASMGVIEASLQDLCKAAAHVKLERQRWESIRAGSLSLAANHALRLGIWRALRLGGKPGEYAPVIAPLGSGRTRLGLGIRRRALQRSEQALACHAGALHDLRVLLRDVGGEWLELGRYVGGPPLAAMPWDAVPCKEQQQQLLAACSRVLTQMRGTADVLRQRGPYALYCEPFPSGARGVDAAPLNPTRAGLITATRELLNSLRILRHATAHRGAPRGLRSPNWVQRRSLVWTGLVLLLAHGYVHWLPILLPLRADAYRAATKAAADLGRFWVTHVNEPVTAIVQELFHGGYKPTIDPEQVKETRESLRRMLADFVRDTHKEAHGAKEPEVLREALQRAEEGSMESVTAAYEEQVRAPVSNIINGKLLRSLMLLVQQLRLLMEEEVESVDSLLKRNDFNLQVMATVPALALVGGLFLLLRSSWRRLHRSDAARRDPIEAIQAEVIAIEALLTRAEGTSRQSDHGFQRCEVSAFEASPMDLSEIGELVFSVQRLRDAGSMWLRGLARKELLQDALLLLDSGRLDASQRSRVARTLLRRLDSVNYGRDHW
jgi:hypothetical protein